MNSIIPTTAAPARPAPKKNGVDGLYACHSQPDIRLAGLLDTHPG